MPASSVEFKKNVAEGVDVRMADCVWLSDGGALLFKYTVLHKKDLTLKFFQIRVARWWYCQISFVDTYSYPNCKVLYEDCLISSHIFIPDHPHLLDPSFTSRGKDRSWTRCGGFRQLLGGRSKKIVQLKHSFILRGYRSLNIFVLYYWHILLETLAAIKKKEWELKAEKMQNKERDFNNSLTAKIEQAYVYYRGPKWLVEMIWIV